jgi:hypothetical protein
MIISKEYRQLMDSPALTDRFRAGDYFLYEEEESVLKDFIDSFYESAKQNGCVPLNVFFEFMSLLDLIRDGDTDEVVNLAAYAFVECSKLQRDIEKRKQCGE